MKYSLLIASLFCLHIATSFAQTTGPGRVENGDVAKLKEAIEWANSEAAEGMIEASGTFVFGENDEMPTITGHVYISCAYPCEDESNAVKFVGNPGPDRLFKIEPNARLTLHRVTISNFTVCSPLGGETLPLIENDGFLRIEYSGIRQMSEVSCGPPRFTVSSPLIFNSGRMDIENSSFDNTGVGYGGEIVNEGLANFQAVSIEASSGPPSLAFWFTNRDEWNFYNVTYHGRPELGLADAGTPNVPINIANSIFDNSGGKWCAYANSLGYNLTDSELCNFNATNDLNGVPTGILPLTYENNSPNGVFPLSAASPAIDSARRPECGIRTIYDGDGNGSKECDRGAFEFVPGGLSEGGANGLFYDPNHNGHYVYVLDNVYNTMVMWTAFDREGKPAWVFAIGELVAGKSMIADAYINTNGVLTDEGPVDVELDQPFGTLQLELDSCDGGHFFFNSNLPEFESGQFELKRLAHVAQIGCQDGIGAPYEP